VVLNGFWGVRQFNFVVVVVAMVSHNGRIKLHLRSCTGKGVDTREVGKGR
jgi:hypothetical protein